jgi:tRNA threonylcarbamoyladenosine modification (KEOPS) complex  Pcc1 subunit
MSDGSLGSENSMILHLQGFSEAENTTISNELNSKFNLHSKVITHKTKYFVVKIPARDASTLRALIKPHMLPMFAYKLPR